jgi:hypothetical protein
MPITDDPKVVDISSRLAEMMQASEAEEDRKPFVRKQPRLGLHHGIPKWEYLLWDAFGSGQINKVGHSPAHMRTDWLKGDDAATSKMLTGSAVHACVFEPDSEWLKYARLPDGLDRRHKEYTAMAEEYGGDYVLKDHEYDSCIGIRDSLNSHSRIRRLLAAGDPEVTFAWEDPATGIPLKGRADWLNTDLATCFDLKTTGDARETQFRRIASSKGYPVQGAHYTTGLNEVGVETRHYAIVAAELSEPYDVVLYRMSTRDMMIAGEYWQTLVDYLGHCVETGDWPGYPQHTHVLSMGMWWESDMQEKIAIMREAMVA